MTDKTYKILAITDEKGKQKTDFESYDLNKEIVGLDIKENNKITIYKKYESVYKNIDCVQEFKRYENGFITIKTKDTIYILIDITNEEVNNDFVYIIFKGKYEQETRNVTNRYSKVLEKILQNDNQKYSWDSIDGGSIEIWNANTDTWFCTIDNDNLENKNIEEINNYIQKRISQSYNNN